MITYTYFTTLRGHNATERYAHSGREMIADYLPISKFEKCSSPEQKNRSIGAGSLEFLCSLCRQQEKSVLSIHR